MTARTRAGLITAAIHAAAIPVVLIISASVQIGVLDATASPTLPDWLEWPLHTVPSFVCGAFLLVMARETVEANVVGASEARWPLRAAPLLAAAGLPTAFGAWLLLAKGHSGLNGLIVIPALIFWGAVAGEWIAHSWRSAGRRGDALLRRSFFGAVGLLGCLVLLGIVLRSPAGELEAAREKCRREYARSRSAEDSAFTDQWQPTVARELGTRSCADLLSGGSNGSPVR